MNKTNSLSILYYCTALFLTLSILSGCTTAPKHDPDFAPTMPVVKEQKPQDYSDDYVNKRQGYMGEEEMLLGGGIYQAGQEIILYEDMKARRIGDTITIRLAERTNASKSAKTDASKDQETSLTNPKILGASPTFNATGLLPLDINNGNTLETGLTSSQKFAGSGKSSQSNSLTGDITVTVADVLPNGNMIVRGEKRLNFNDGNEYIKIAGIVRPYDVGPDNTVLSTKLADATIIYNGDGAVADSNRMGWLARFFNSALSPF